MVVVTREGRNKMKEKVIVKEDSCENLLMHIVELQLS